MKKITFILFALIAGTTFAQTADALAGADIVSPLTIVQAADFNFGKVSNAGGTVVINTDNSDGGSTAGFLGSNTLTAAAFTVNATDTYTYAVNLPTEVTLTNQITGVETMKVTVLNHASTEEGTGADETFGVGGTLTVGAGQVPGYYEGTMTVGVSYN